MEIAIIISKKDKAGLNIQSFLLNFLKENLNYKSAKLYLIEEDIIYANLNNIKADFIIFASRHSSINELPCYCCHATGNWNKAEFGGIDNKLSLSSAFILRETLILLNKQNELPSFQEISHHGPLINTPHIFIEIGSTEKEWTNKNYGNFISKTIINLIDLLHNFEDVNSFINKYKTINPNVNVAIGLGGLHYMQNFSKLILNKNIAISHACPKYLLDYFNENMLNEVISKTLEKIDFFILDWKSLQNKEEIIKILNKNNIKYKKIKEII
jgi:D-aminoacyl-tRNA deacylase